MSQDKTIFRSLFNTASDDTVFRLHLLNIDDIFNGSKNELESQLKNLPGLLEVPVVKYQLALKDIVDSDTKTALKVHVMELVLDFKLNFEPRREKKQPNDSTHNGFFSRLIQSLGHSRSSSVVNSDTTTETDK